MKNEILELVKNKVEYYIKFRAKTFQNQSIYRCPSAIIFGTLDRGRYDSLEDTDEESFYYEIVKVDLMDVDGNLFTTLFTKDAEFGGVHSVNSFFKDLWIPKSKLIISLWEN